MIRRIWTPALLALGLAGLSHPVAAQEEPGKGSLGATLGVPFVLSDSDLSEGQRPRVMLKLHFQYVMNPSWRLSLRGGWGWTGYASDVYAPYPLPGSSGTIDSTKIDQLTYLYPFTATAVYRRTMSENWTVFGGAGLGVYQVRIVNDRQSIYDPVTFERYALWSPGVTLEAGGEFAIPANRNVSLELMAGFHQLLRGDEEKFPSGYSGPHSFLDINFGVNVYFTLPGSSPQVTPVLGESDDAEGEAAPPEDAAAPAEPEEKPDTP